MRAGPADTLEMVLVEDIALLIWKKARLDRAEAAVQVGNYACWNNMRHQRERTEERDRDRDTACLRGNASNSPIDGCL